MVCCDSIESELVDYPTDSIGQHMFHSKYGKQEMRVSTRTGAIADSHRKILTSWMFTALFIGSFSNLAAQEIGNAPAGRRLANDWCSSCHVIGPVAERGTSNGAPTFTAIARMKSTTPMALKVFLQTPHSRMPDLHLSRSEIDDLTVYILSLKHR
jgi:mono/diheme cytochrome c family protein